jgi:hypothetical protein
MEQIMACLLTEIRANNEKFEVLRGILVSRMDIQQIKTGVIQEEIIPKIDVQQERMEASKNAWRNETTACQEETKACLEKAKANPEKMTAGLEEMEDAVETN